MPATGIKRKLATEALATAGLHLVAKVRGVILLPVLVHVGSEALYGVWTMLAGVVALLIPIVNLNAHQGLLRFAAPLDNSSSRRLFRHVTAFSWVAAAGFAAVGTAIALRYRGSYPPAVTRDVIVFTALQVPLWVAVRVNSSYLRARGRTIGAQLSELGAQFVVTIAACTLFLLGFGLAAVQAATAALLLVEVWLVVAIIAKSRESLEKVTGASTPTLSKVLLFSLPFIPGAFSDWALFISDRYIIALYHDETVVGIYAGCYAVAQLLQIVSYPLEYAITPVLPRLWDGGERAEAADLLKKCVHLALAILAPASTVVVIAGPVVLSLLGSDAMAAEASTLLPLLCWGITILACTRMIAHVPLVAHQGRSVMVRVGATAAINIALNMVLVPFVGAVGSALTTLLSYALYAVLILRLTRPLAPDLVDLRRPVRICAAALLPAAIALVHMDSIAVRLAACVGYLVAYVGLAWLFRAITSEDWRLLQRALRRRP